MKKYCVLPALILLILVFAPFVQESDADSQQILVGDVSFVFIDDNVDVSSGGTTNVAIMVQSNNGTHSVSISGSNGDVYVQSMIFGITEEDEPQQVNIAFSAGKYCKHGTFDLPMTITVDSSLSDTVVFHVSVSSYYSNDQYFNKILGFFDNPFPEPFNQLASTLGITAILWVVIAFIVVGIVDVIALVAFKDEKDSQYLDRKLKISLFACVIVYGAINCLRIIAIPENIIATINFWAVLFYIVILSYIGWKFYEAIVSRILNSLEKKTGDEWIYESFSSLFFAIGKILIVAISVASILNALGMNLAVIIAGAGIAGIAISLGTKSAFGELFSGITLLITRPFKAGDTILINDETDDMTVVKVGVLNTEFKTRYNVDHFVLSNNMLAQSKITNITKKTKIYRTFLYMDLDKNENPELVKKLMIEAAMENPNVIKDGSYSKPSARLNNLEHGIATYRLSVYVDDYGNRGDISGKLREEIFKKFSDNGIFIPYPKKDITILKDGEAPQ